MFDYDHDEYIVPEWSICYLINNQIEDLTDADMFCATTFLDGLNRQGYTFTLSCGDNPFFSSYNDIDCLAGSCYDLTVTWIPTS